MNEERLVVIKPECEEPERTARMEEVLAPALAAASSRGTKIVTYETAGDVEGAISLGELRDSRILFAVCLTGSGVNFEYYKLLDVLRKGAGPDGCLAGSVAGILVDGAGELYTKSLARTLAFAANRAGCAFPGKPLVEATGSLKNFHVLSGITGLAPADVYRDQTVALVFKILDFDRPAPAGKLLAIHASSRDTSNTLLLWDKVKKNLSGDIEVREISLRNGDLLDCRGCSYEQCLHFGELGGCFYGGIMTEQAFPAIVESDVLVMICPNYNDAVSANLTAFINRLTALFRTRDFTKKRVYALVVSGYSGGDIVAEQLIGAFNFNKEMILPANFAMVETANDPSSILSVENIDDKAKDFASRIW